MPIETSFVAEVWVFAAKDYTHKGFCVLVLMFSDGISVSILVCLRWGRTYLRADSVENPPTCEQSGTWQLSCLSALLSTVDSVGTSRVELGLLIPKAVKVCKEG